MQPNHPTQPIQFTQPTQSSFSYENDYRIALNIVKKIFTHITLGIEHDRSKKKLNLFEKGIIKGMINESTLNGINNYIINMYPNDIKPLIDDIEIEIQKRRR